MSYRMKDFLGQDRYSTQAANAVGPQEKAFTWHLLQILSLKGYHIRWTTVNLSFKVTSATFSPVDIISYIMKKT